MLYCLEVNPYLGSVPLPKKYWKIENNILKVKLPTDPWGRLSRNHKRQLKKVIDRPNIRKYMKLFEFGGAGPLSGNSSIICDLDGSPLGASETFGSVADFYVAQALRINCEVANGYAWGEIFFLQAGNLKIERRLIAAWEGVSDKLNLRIDDPIIAKLGFLPRAAIEAAVAKAVCQDCCHVHYAAQ